MTFSCGFAPMFLVLFAAACFQLALARAAGSVPTVTTDKPDYPPGDTARITGTGFLPGEQVECQVLRLDASFDPSVAHLPWLVAADASGKLQTSWFVTWDAAGAALELTAVGQTSSLVASVAFTDSANSCPPPPTGTPLTGTPAGGFAMDGDLQANADTGDWIPGSGSGGSVMTDTGIPLNAATTFHLSDGFGAAENNFNSGLKVDDNPNVWTWVINPTPDKDDINNALLHISDASDGHRWLVVSADRASNNGDSYVDFEFLQRPLSITTNSDGVSGGFTSDGPHGGRTTNDFLLTVSFTKGGTTPGVCLERWLASGTGYDYVDTPLPTGAVFGAVNTSGIPVPYGAFGTTTYDVNTFAEVAVDVTELIAGFDRCLSVGVQSIMVKTKTSQSPQATIVDFIAPLSIDLKLGPSADAGPDQTKCSEGAATTFTLDGKAYAGLDPIVSTNWTVISGSAIIDSPNSLTTSVHVSSAPATLRLTLSTAVESGCSKTDDVVLTVNQSPACTITGAALVCPSSANTYSGPAGMASYAWSISGGGGILGSTSSQTVAVTADSGCNQNFTLTLTVTDGIACSSTCQQDFPVNDTVAPTILGVPAGGHLGCNPASLPTDVSVKALVTATDDCTGSPMVNVSHLDGGTACTPTRTFTITSTDGCNNTSAPTTVVYQWKTDAAKPVLSGLPELTASYQCYGDVPAPPAVTANDNCDGQVTVNYAQVLANPAGSCNVTITRTWTAGDSCGNTASFTQTITVNDNLPPIVTCPPKKTVRLNSPSDPSVTGSATATDNCDPAPTITHSDSTAPGNCPNTTVITRTWTATDACGNESSCLQTIMVGDTIAPAITCPPTAMVECNTSTDPSVTGSATVTAGTDPNPVVSHSDIEAPGSCPKTKVITRTWTAADSCGSKGTCVQMITVVDTIAPVFSTCPANITVDCNASTDASITGSPTATDNCDPNPAISYSDAVTGTCSKIITRTWTATDCAGHSSRCVQTITVSDTTAPLISCPPDTTVKEYTSTDPGVTGRATASDDCDAVPVITYSDATSGVTPVIITRTWTATDCAGNQSTCNQTITILDEPSSEGTLITDSMRRTLPNNQLRLIFTQDTQKMPCYKLTASNPGQFYYNVFYTAAPGSNVTFHVTLPYPWVTQGARPIEVYDGVTANNSGGQICLAPGNKILAGSQQVTLSSYGSKPVMGVTTYTLNVTMTVPSTGFVFLAIHLDYGLKASTGYGHNGAGDATMGGSTGTIPIPNNQSYAFSVTGAAGGSALVSSYNAFKKNPGVGGLAHSQITTFSVPGSTVKLKDAKGTVLGSGVTDQDGWYVLNYRANGKAATYYVTLTPPARFGTTQTKAITLKPNGYVQVDFTTK